jgi:hypothetical protein
MKNQKFEIVLEDFGLSEKQIDTLEKELHGVVAKHLIGAQSGTSIGKKIIKNPEWLGIWLKKFKADIFIQRAKTFDVIKINQLG